MKKNNRKFHYSVYNSMDPDQAPCFVSADLGSNCLQRFSVDNFF